ncbi:hypothetical protein [Mycoplasma sp. 4404]|uniref:hypothetical protein n=1 Tax=Mycoplasma sp. 4404 TaxID=3108530 RepID=UPI002B1E8E12|nr:hypothetical protein [Mycoplasma sp. 4404]MEA4162526.1 hypothetical protein [Mycoplasma sp. 4404]
MNFNNNTSKLYVYKIESNKPLSFIKHSINVINLPEPEEFDVIKLNHTKLSNTLLDDGNVSNELFNSYTISGDSDLYNYLEVEPSKNIFYLFTFDSPYVIQFNEFYIIENKIDNMELNDVLEAYADITLTQLDYYKELHNIDFHFKFQGNETTINQLDDLVIKTNKGALINSINLLDDKYQIIKATNKSQSPYMLIINPFNVKGNNYSLNFWSLAGNNFIPLKEYLNNRDVRNEYIDFCKYLVNVSKIVRTSFQGMNEEQLKKFEEKYGKISDLKNWTDQQVQNKLNEYVVNGYYHKTNILKAYLLAFSNDINSTYAFKGGFNSENMLYSPLVVWYHNNNAKWFSYMYYINTNNEIHSRLQNNFLNNNIVKFNGSNIQLSLVPNVLEEKDYSATPIEFNDKTYNFNYVSYLFLTPQGFKKLVDYSSYANEDYENKFIRKRIPICYRKDVESVWDVGGIGPSSRASYYDGWSLTPSMWADLLHMYPDIDTKQTNSTGKLWNIFDTKVEIRENDTSDSMIFLKRLVREYIDQKIRETQNIDNSYTLSKIFYLTKYGQYANSDDNSFKEFCDNNLDLSEEEQNFFTEIKEKFTPSVYLKNSCYGIVELMYEKQVNSNYSPSEFYDLLKDTIFNTPEEFVNSTGLTEADFLESFTIHKEQPEQINSIEVRALWLDWIEISGTKFITKNKPYNKIIFW